MPGFRPACGGRKPAAAARKRRPTSIRMSGNWEIGGRVLHPHKAAVGNRRAGCHPAPLLPACAPTGMRCDCREASRTALWAVMPGFRPACGGRKPAAAAQKRRPTSARMSGNWEIGGRVLNPHKGGGWQPPRRMPSCPTSSGVRAYGHAVRLPGGRRTALRAVMPGFRPACGGRKPAAAAQKRRPTSAGMWGKVVNLQKGGWESVQTDLPKGGGCQLRGASGAWAGQEAYPTDGRRAGGLRSGVAGGWDGGAGSLRIRRGRPAGGRLWRARWPGCSERRRSAG